MSNPNWRTTSVATHGLRSDGLAPRKGRVAPGRVAVAHSVVAVIALLAVSPTGPVGSWIQYCM